MLMRFKEIKKRHLYRTWVGRNKNCVVKIKCLNHQYHFQVIFKDERQYQSSFYEDFEECKKAAEEYIKK